MPQGIFPVPAFKTIPPLDIRPQRGLRARTWLHRNRLDQELADGADPLASEELILRAAQLRTHRERTRIAKVLVKAIGSGHPEARAYSESLGALSTRLQDDLPVDYRGVAKAALLLSGGTPQLRVLSGPDLRKAIDAAHSALDTRREIAVDLRAAA